MFSKFGPSIPPYTKTWILVANRVNASIFETAGSLKNPRLIDRCEFVRGRMRNREIDSDRRSGAVSTSGNAYPVHGLTNKNEAHTHLAEVFSRELAQKLDAAHANGAFERLVLVAEGRFLGQIQAHLSPSTKLRIISTIPKDIAGLKNGELVRQLERYEPLEIAS